jgi:hypothetical protein
VPVLGVAEGQIVSTPEPAVAPGRPAGRRYAAYVLVVHVMTTFLTLE